MYIYMYIYIYINVSCILMVSSMKNSMKFHSQKLPIIGRWVYAIVSKFARKKMLVC